MRTETTINNTRDFYIGKSLHNLPALRKSAFKPTAVCWPKRPCNNCSIRASSTVGAPQRCGLADPTTQALWRAMLLFELLPAGFSNRQLRTHLAQLLGQPVSQLTQGRMTYHLRRLRMHGMIERIPKSHRYRLTGFGLRTALFCTRAWGRIFRRGLGMALPSTSPIPNPNLRSFERLTHKSTPGLITLNWLLKT